MGHRTLYQKNVQDRSSLRYFLGFLARLKQHIKHERARRVARKRGAIIGDNVILPLSLARRANTNLIVGDNTSIHTNKISSLRFPLKIGNNVIIGNDVKIVMGSHNIDSPEWDNYRPNQGLIIQDYVWLCPDSVILPSCSLVGYGAILGANAVAIKNIEQMSVVAGNPAIEIKKRKTVHSDLIVESLLGGDLKAYIKTRKAR